MKLGSKTKVTKLQFLLSKSKEIKNLFTETMYELEQVNQEINDEVSKKVSHIELLKSECDVLNETRYANEKMRSKMAVLLGLEDDSDQAVEAVQG